MQRRCMVQSVERSGQQLRCTWSLQHKDADAMQVLGTGSNASLLYSVDARSHHLPAAKRHVASDHLHDLGMTATLVDLLILQRQLLIPSPTCLSSAPIVSIVHRSTRTHDVKLITPLHSQAPAGSTYHAIFITRVVSLLDQERLNRKLHVHRSHAAEKKRLSSNGSMSLSPQLASDPENDGNM